jgi:ribosomal-protein-alanine N-acetyltransferase
VAAVSEVNRVKVRGLKPDDAPTLAEFFSVIESDPAGAEYFHPHAMDADAARRVCGFADAGSDEYFAAFDGGRIVGYGMLRGWADGYEVPAFGVCVRPEARRSGVGASLLSWAVDRARDRGAAMVMLKVSPRNEAAIALYRSRGFVFSGETMGSELVGRLSITPRE